MSNMKLDREYAAEVNYLLSFREVPATFRDNFSPTFFNNLRLS